jgi:hypothetical protein
MFWLFWFGMCVGVGLFASNKGRSGIGWFLLAFIFSPLIAGVILACTKDLSVVEDISKVQMEQQHLKDRVVLNEKITEHRLNRVESDVNRLGSDQFRNTSAASLQHTKMLDDGNKICPACAETIKAAAIKCKHCGTMLSEIKIVECPYCSENISANDIICRHCNSNINTENNINFMNTSRF